MPIKETLLLNQSHIFAKDILGNLVFEDGLKCDYKSTNVQLKLYEIAFKLKPIIERLDFSSNPLPVQIEAVKTIRGCLDMISFNKGDVKTVHADRFKIDSVAKMALRGQGNCHGCSSVMGAFLYPFRNILGIDLKYRGGYSFKVADNEEVKNNVERH